MVNVDPFEGMECGFFAADWDLKVGIEHLYIDVYPDIKLSFSGAGGVSAQNLTTAGRVTIDTFAGDQGDDRSCMGRGAP